MVSVDSKKKKTTTIPTDIEKGLQREMRRLSAKKKDGDDDDYDDDNDAHALVQKESDIFETSLSNEEALLNRWTDNAVSIGSTVNELKEKSGLKTSRQPQKRSPPKIIENDSTSPTTSSGIVTPVTTTGSPTTITKRSKIKTVPSRNSDIHGGGPPKKCLIPELSTQDVLNIPNSQLKDGSLEIFSPVIVNNPYEYPLMAGKKRDFSFIDEDNETQK